MPDASSSKQTDSVADTFCIPRFDLTILSVLDGASWRLFEHLEISDLEKEDGLLALLTGLDAH